jgi:hypothetical protein
MRNKIIAVNAIIILIVGLLSFAVVRWTLTSAASNPTQLSEDAKHAAQGASARLQFDALRTERWLAARASDPAAIDALSKATQSARGEAAMSLCDSLASTAKGIFESAPSLVVLVDSHGRSVGRNGSTLMRNDDLGAVYPGLKEAIATGHSGSDVWVNKERNDQYLVSYAPVRDTSGAILGAIVAGTTLNDELSRVSDATTGRALALVIPAGDGLTLVAHSTLSSAGLEAAVNANSGAKDSIKSVLVSGHSSAVAAGDVFIGAAAFDGIGGGKHAVALVAEVPASVIDNPSSLATPILAVMGLGLVLVVVGGWLLGNYITRPINMLEEGLLQILNGQSDKRFELDHSDLGGLAFRIDQLLNQLMGVEEDTTDAEGRVSKAPAASNFTDAMSVDEKPPMSEQSVAIAAQLGAEPEVQYYARLYREYIAAKRALGEATDHITEQAFASRIQGMERDASNKHGRPVRYQVKATGKEVILIAIPLP